MCLTCFLGCFSPLFSVSVQGQSPKSPQQPNLAIQTLRSTVPMEVPRQCGYGQRQRVGTPRVRFTGVTDFGGVPLLTPVRWVRNPPKRSQSFLSGNSGNGLATLTKCCPNVVPQQRGKHKRFFCAFFVSWISAKFSKIFTLHKNKHFVHQNMTK